MTIAKNSFRDHALFLPGKLEMTQNKCIQKSVFPYSLSFILKFEDKSCIQFSFRSYLFLMYRVYRTWVKKHFSREIKRLNKLTSSEDKSKCLR